MYRQVQINAMPPHLRQSLLLSLLQQGSEGWEAKHNWPEVRADQARAHKLVPVPRLQRHVLVLDHAVQYKGGEQDVAVLRGKGERRVVVLIQYRAPYLLTLGAHLLHQHIHLLRRVFLCTAQPPIHHKGSFTTDLGIRGITPHFENRTLALVRSQPLPPPPGKVRRSHHIIQARTHPLYLNLLENKRQSILETLDRRAIYHHLTHVSADSPRSCHLLHQ